MKKALIALLLIVFLFNSFVLALPFNEQNLLNLKPLLSERIKTKAEMVQGSKIIPALIFGLLGASIIANNLTESNFENNENIRLSNLMAGSLFITIGLDSYFSKDPETSKLEVLNSLGETGIEKEKYSYFMYKESAAEDKLLRERASFLWTMEGLSFALLPVLTPKASSDTKSISTVVGILFCGMALYNYLFPSPAETEMQAIDNELKR